MNGLMPTFGAFGPPKLGFTLVGTNTHNGGATGPDSIAFPAGTDTGDFILLFSRAQTNFAVADFTAIGQGLHYRIRQAGDSSGVQYASSSALTDVRAGLIVLRPARPIVSVTSTSIGAAVTYPEVKAPAVFQISHKYVLNTVQAAPSDQAQFTDFLWMPQNWGWLAIKRSAGIAPAFAAVAAHNARNYLTIK